MASLSLYGPISSSSVSISMDDSRSSLLSDLAAGLRPSDGGAELFGIAEASERVGAIRRLDVGPPLPPPRAAAPFAVIGRRESKSSDDSESTSGRPPGERKEEEEEAAALRLPLALEEGELCAALL